MTRVIWFLGLDKDRADEVAKDLRDRGRKARVYQRTMRAEGLSVWCYVVVTDGP